MGILATVAPRDVGDVLAMCSLKRQLNVVTVLVGSTLFSVERS